MRKALTSWISVVLGTKQIAPDKKKTIINPNFLPSQIKTEINLFFKKQ